MADKKKSTAKASKSLPNKLSATTAKNVKGGMMKADPVPKK